MKTTLVAVPIRIVSFSLTRMGFPLRYELSANTSTFAIGKHLFGSDAELFKNFCNVTMLPLVADAPSNVCADLNPHNDHLTKTCLKKRDLKERKHQ